MAHYVTKITKQYAYDTMPPQTYRVEWSNGEVFEGFTGAELLQEFMTIKVEHAERIRLLWMYRQAQYPKPHTSFYEKLYLTTLDATGHEGTCNYWYLIEANGYAHMGFTTRKGLLKWLAERAILLTEPLPEHGVYSTQHLLGSYEMVSHMDAVECYSIEGAHVRVVNNGQYTLAILARDDNGTVQEHVCNPNVKDRIIFDATESRALCV
jgi:hypothetical protein